MDFVKRDKHPQLAIGFILIFIALAGCAASPPPAKGSKTEPNEIVFSAKTSGPNKGCFKSDRVARGRTKCSLWNPLTLCAQNGQWIRWTTEGNDIEKIEFKKEDPLDRNQCEGALPGKTYECAVRADIAPNKYKYSVKLDKCEIHDPKIIITN